ncbi:MAG TPA: hypothetical protein VGC42_25015 [Kofleriaceae bacterium]
MESRTPGQASRWQGGALACRAASLPSFDRALDELIARAHQVEPDGSPAGIVEVADEASGLRDQVAALQRKLDDAERRSRAPLPAAPARLARPAWTALAAGIVVGAAAMFGGYRALGGEAAPSPPPVASAPAPVPAPSMLATTSCTAPSPTLAAPAPSPTLAAPVPAAAPIAAPSSAAAAPSQPDAVMSPAPARRRRSGVTSRPDTSILDPFGAPDAPPAAAAPAPAPQPAPQPGGLIDPFR